MNLSLSPAAKVSGEISVPGDKSLSHRAAIFGALAFGTTRISNFLRAEDTRSTLDCLAQLGASWRDENGIIAIEGAGFDGLQQSSSPLNCGNSGTTMRLLLGVLAGRPFPTILEGDASLSRRPMDRVKIPLEKMGAKIFGRGEKNAPPISVRGGDLHDIEYELPVASAQVKSAILLAGLQASGETFVIEPKPSRDHTERMLQAFGVQILQGENHKIGVCGGAKLRAADVQVAGDISAAAFFFALASLRPDWKITVKDCGTNPTRTGVLDVLEMMGATVEIKNLRESGGESLADVCVTGHELRGVEISGAMIPRLIDELPVLALVATQAQGTTIIRDAAEMRVKESDRIAVIAQELRKLGANIEELPDGLKISGPTKLRGANVWSPRGDHRIAMTLAVAAMIADGETIIQNAEAMSSSFPEFPKLLKTVCA